MKSIRICIALGLTAALAAALLACGGTPAPADTTAAETTAPVPVVEPICIASGAATDYTVIRADEASELVTETTTACWKAFQDTLGARIQIGTDWVKRGEEPPAMADEILIGLTNRPESIELTASLAPGSYRIKVVDRRIVICATAEWMLENAVEDFFSRAEQDATGRWVIPGNLDVTGDLSAFARPGWTLDALPAYDGGELAAETFYEQLNFEKSSANSRMICVRNTLRREFDDYLGKAEANGFAVTPVTDADGIKAVRLAKDETMAYVYFVERANEARVVLERGDNTPLADFNYSYDKKPHDTTTMYQFGLMMDKDGIDFQYNNNTRLNCGHMYFMKLADNSIVVIDGGGIQQMSNATAAELLRLFREVTGTPENGVVRISGWFISHRHPDHYNGFTRFLTKYNEQVKIERIFYNIEKSNDDMDRIRSLLSRFYDGILYHKPHTGETIQLADVTFDVLYTLEDQVNASTGAIESSDFNDTSTVLRINFDGARLLLLGDASGGAEKVLVRNYAADALKSDILQVAHHGWNNLASLYNAVKPAISLYPQSSGGARKGLNGNAAKVLDRVTLVSDEIYYAGDETVGVTVVSGKPTVTYRAPVVGEEYSGWGY